MREKVKPDRIESVFVPRALLEDTWSYLQRRGQDGLEGVAYWTGDATPERAVVSHVLYPDAYAEEGFLHIEVAPATVMRLAERVQDLDEFLLARVHSHAYEAFHSPIDDLGCLSGRVGMLSIVIPNFAEGPPSLASAAAYERAQEGHWREMAPEEVRRRLRVR